MFAAVSPWVATKVISTKASNTHPHTIQKGEGFMKKQRFRLSHMIPNAWFYRLRDYNNKPLPSAYSSLTSNHRNHPRNSFCYTPTIHQVYTTTTINNRPTDLTHTLHQDFFLSATSSPFSESTQSFDQPTSTDDRCCRLITYSDQIQYNEKSCTNKIQDSTFQRPPPIITKPTKSNMETSSMVEKKEETCSQSSVSIKIVKENISNDQTSGRKSISGNNIRSDSLITPIVDGNNGHKNQKDRSSGCCVVKSSFDPQKDLKESMVEMILENNIKGSKDLEKLLAFYLSLNSNEYKEMIVKAFEQICLTYKFCVQ